jgi:ABC-type nitrate/sulfonate/bicarbonate transport system substrate-binding protein
VAAGAIRSIVKAQKALQANPALSTDIGRRLFPADEAELIAGLIARDAPFYQPGITHEAVDGLMKFATRGGLIRQPVPYADLVATELSHLWNE